MILYDKERLIDMMEAFYTLSELRMELAYPDTQEIFAWPRPNQFTSFCLLVRSNPEINQKCRECDLFHMEECKKKNGPIIYKCHMGLTEVIGPIKEDEVIICYLWAGQFIKEESSEESRRAIFDHAVKYNFEEKALREAIAEIKCISSQKLNASVKIFEALVSKILSGKLITYTRMKFINNLNLFIDSHISENITVKDIYDHLQIKRTSMYEYSKKYLDCGISEYIVRRKINYAKKLLKNSRVKIGELSLKTGFTDQNYFSRVFKKMTNLSPREYRKGIITRGAVFPETNAGLQEETVGWEM